MPEALEQARLEARLRRDRETLAVLGWAQLRAGRFLEARATLRRALSRGVKDAELELLAGGVERALGNLVGARQHLAAARSINPALEASLRVRLGLE